jgi:hypothetical protein
MSRGFGRLGSNARLIAPTSIHRKNRVGARPKEVPEEHWPR